MEVGGALWPVTSGMFGSPANPDDREDTPFATFPPEVEKGLAFCEASKKDVTSISKSVQSMIGDFKARTLTPHETIAEQCNQLRSKAVKPSFGSTMKDAHSTYVELGRVERKSHDEITSQFIDGFTKEWLKNGVGKQLEDISELKKRRLEKDACATSANNHPDDQERANRSANADQEYNNQLAVVEEDLKVLQSHYSQTVTEAKNLMQLLASHYSKACDTVKSGASKLAKA